MTLTDFLRARIAEDEGIAIYAQTRDDLQPEDWGGWWFGHHQHYSRHDPARVIAECEAKREILGLLEADVADPRNTVRRIWAAEILSGMGAVYASHPHYNPEWRP